MYEEFSPGEQSAAKNAAVDVLLIGRDQNLTDYRERVLRWAEFSTRVVPPPADLEPDVLPCARVAILCHSLSVEERRHIALKLRSSHPRMRIIALDTHAHTVTEPARYDGVLENLAGPESLIRTVRQHLQSAN